MIQQDNYSEVRCIGRRIMLLHSQFCSCKEFLDILHPRFSSTITCLFHISLSLFPCLFSTQMTHNIFHTHTLLFHTHTLFFTRQNTRGYTHTCAHDTLGLIISIFLVVIFFYFLLSGVGQIFFYCKFCNQFGNQTTTNSPIFQVLIVNFVVVLN